MNVGVLVSFYAKRRLSISRMWSPLPLDIFKIMGVGNTLPALKEFYDALLNPSIFQPRKPRREFYPRRYCTRNNLSLF